MARRKLISPKEKTRAQALFALFQETYPEVRCTLDFRSPLQLLIMTILAAQCTDARVNVVCRDL
ncbi:MAG TPA: endonuclease III, partial [Candidatus Hydrogenedentes bacterium]|nr:endonuclease III [Candidatus Hydrogenedentota bacterium]